MNRRDFFTAGITKALSKIYQEVTNNFLQAKQVFEYYSRPSDLSDFDIFFLGKSYYPVLEQMPYDEVAEHARRLGINLENKSKIELVRKIFEFEEKKSNSRN